MKGWVKGVGVLVLVAAAYWAWPVVGAAQLASAVRGGDAGDIYAHIDPDSLRRSLTRQIARAYLDVSGKADKLGALGRSVAGSAVTTVADPYVAEMLTPENLAALLGRGRVDGLKVGDRTLAVKTGMPSLNHLLDGNVLSALTGSYFDALDDFVVPVETDDGQSYGVHMRRRGLQWRLGGVDLPKPMVEEIARAILGGEKQALLERR